MDAALQQRSDRKQEDVVLRRKTSRAAWKFSFSSSEPASILPLHASVYPSLPPGRPAGTAFSGGDDAQLPDPAPKPTADGLEPLSSLPPGIEPDSTQLEAQKAVRLNAKRALRDYLQYLSHFDYTPELPIEVAEEFARKVNYAS